MANSKIYLKSEAGGTTVLSRDTTATSGNLVLPASGNVASVDIAVTDNAVARYDGTTGKLQNSSVIIDDNGNVGIGTQTFNGLGGSGFKNYIINGNFDIWQYGTSQTTYGYGSADRWYSGNIGSTKTHSQVVCTDAERALFNAYKFSRTVVSSVTGVANYVTTSQRIEDVTKLAGKTVTVSFWAKADSNKNIWVEFRQFFGVGGSASPLVNGIYGQAVTLTTTWQKKTITVALPSIVGKTLGTDGVHTSFTELQFWFDVGSVFLSRIPTGVQQSGTFDIAQVQLEEGSIATPFENRPIGLELSLCQRYYEISSVIATNLIAASNSYQGGIVHWNYKVTKRINPTIAIVINNGTKTALTQDAGMEGCTFAPSTQATNVANYIRLVATCSSEL
jgi:hypothetical protein